MDSTEVDPSLPESGSTRGTVLVTGATGYVGSRLVPRLLEDGWQVRVLGRSAERMATHPWASRVEVVEGDAADREVLDRAHHGVQVSYHLLHSMAAGDDFAERDRALARDFAASAAAAGVRRVVHLGGLHPEDEELSPHLASRAEVEQILLDGRVPTAVLRAAIIVGRGSASFEMLRHLTERLPVMVAPAWLDNKIQPIAIRDVIHLLAGSADLPPEQDRAFDIGGPEVLSYTDLIDRYAAAAGLPRRRVARLSALTPWLASHWIGLVTPVPTAVARPLVQSLVHEVVCQENDLAQWVPDLPGGRLSLEDALQAALTDSGDPADPGWSGPAEHTDRYRREVAASAEDAWSALVELVRADLGAAARVVDLEPGRLIRWQLRTDRLGPIEVVAGITPLTEERCRLELTTHQVPRGLLGRLTWNALLPARVVAQAGIGERWVRMVRSRQRGRGEGREGDGS